ncbi:LOW QUALITY PROTEIN: polyadenylate-binding protein-interacting protein 1-like [Uloborus diversus]|uniref:LOW QUALITY PROTEIN: polyadenylate-binding protein-interacting protein 1-like n=1 Tax=Uloborus diversus TaxID=327109 RepID=UPI00240942AB|nr:LOW QUALITY PROTEIN: polyadenylate-binding protein-interacting protein 1-like [Uloborus diversus]
MEQNEGTPGGYGRGRPVEITELRRPLSFSTYATPTEYVPTEANTNGVYAQSSWLSPSRDMTYLASPSGDHARSPQYHGVPLDNTTPGDAEKKPFQLSPYAKEFVPRNFRPESEAVETVRDTIPESYPVQELRSFLSEITMCPGKFERKIQPLTDTLNSMVDDDDTMRAIVNIIFDESIRQSNLRYGGARLCKSLCNDLDPSPHRLNFRSVLLTRCNQEFKRREILAQAEDGGTYLRGFAMFMAELFSQLDVMKQKITVLGDCLPSLIKTILAFPCPDNFKCACQILKLVGAYLEDYERSRTQNVSEAREMDSIMCTLKNLAANQEYNRCIRDMMTNVIKLRESDWGRTNNSESSSYEAPPSTSLTDEPVMYGPDGKPMTHEELMFLQSQYASNLPVDADDFDLYDDNPGDEMPEEISEAYEVFLREHALRH